MNAGARLCPLCDRGSPDALCAVHGVPTVDVAQLEGSPMAFEAGMCLGGRFELERPIAEGGMGSAFLAADRMTGTRCVIKLAKRGPGAVERVRRMFQESRALVLLERHPGIACMIAFGVEPELGVPYLALELVDGPSIDDLLRSGGAFREQRALRLASDIARALAHAHARGILHRDLKPGNVHLEHAGTSDERARVLDFGLAKLADDRDLRALTMPGTTVGTPSYMSPEQILAGAVDGRSDLYALGCLLHTMLMGRPPFEGSDFLAVMKLQLNAPVRELPAELVSRELRTLVRALLEKNKLDRPAGAAEVAAMLDDIAEGRVGQPMRMPAPVIPGASTMPKGEPETVETMVVTKPVEPPQHRPHEPYTFSRVVLPIVVLLAVVAAAVLWMPRASKMRPSTAAVATDPQPEPVALLEEMIVLTSTPAAANVLERGTRIGSTPLEIVRPASGVMRTLRFEVAGHHAKEVMLTAASPERVDVLLAPLTGRTR